MKNLNEQVVYRRNDFRLRSRSDFKLIPIGSVFGSLTVLENDWTIARRSCLVDACKLKCKCGAEIVRCYGSLRRNTIHKSCGCEGHKTRQEMHDLIPVGSKFGRWTVIENGLYKTQGKTTSRACRVICECGNESIHWSGTLNSGKSQSCGCSYRKYPQDIENLWYKLHSKLKRGDFHLNFSEMKILVQNPCLYCGQEPSNVLRHPYRDQTIFYSGIDRIDSKKGYVPGNVVPCCWTCNRMKSAQPLAEFLARIERIYLRNHSVAKIDQQAAAIID